MTFDQFRGCITGAAFAAGDVVVVGAWRTSPFGQFVDVMWVHPSKGRVLLAPTDEIGAYVRNLYSFDQVLTVPVAGGWDGRAVAVCAGPLRVRMLADDRDARSWLFAVRPRALRRSPTWIGIEDRLARPFVGRVIGGADGVRAAGVAPGGQREFYGIEDYRPVASAALSVDGLDRGGLVDLPSDLGIGLSSFPSRPAVVHVTTLVERVGDSGSSG